LIRQLNSVEPRPLHTPNLFARKLVSSDETDRLSVTHMTLDGEHPRVTMTESDVAYYVIEGSGWFAIGDAAAVDVGAGDTAFVPAGVEFGYGGTLTYLNIQSPGFKQSQVQRT
jgi:mannose-6-phosphate isomerase-like protein (cupin superfamily)